MKQLALISDKLYDISKEITFSYRVARAIRILTDHFGTIGHNGIKYFILATIWETLKRLDKGESYDYETAPYCGHHQNGFQNRFITESYWESMGGGETNFKLFGRKLYYCTEDEKTYFIKKS